MRTSLGKLEIVVLGTRGKALGAACPPGSRCTWLLLVVWSRLHCLTGCWRIRLCTVARCSGAAEPLAGSLPLTSKALLYPMGHEVSVLSFGISAWEPCIGTGRGRHAQHVLCSKPYRGSTARAVRGASSSSSSGNYTQHLPQSPRFSFELYL